VSSRNAIPWIAGCLGIALGLVAQTTNHRQNLTHKQLVDKISHVLRWKAFWDGAAAFSGYMAGERVDGKVIRTPKEITVFVSVVGFNLVLRLDSQTQQFHPSLWAYTVGETNESAANRYIRQELRGSADYNCVAMPTKRPDELEGRGQNAGNVLPAARVCRDRNGDAIFGEENILLELPVLNAPAADASHAEVVKLRTAVTKALGYYLGERCAYASVTIPRFSADDPFVYVSVDLGQSCGKGVLAVKRDTRGAWSAGRLFAQGSRTDLDRTLHLIRENALETFRLDFRG
jgi:hypothetical protein